MMLEKLLENGQFEADEFGRLIVKDTQLLAKINGALAGSPDFMLPDVGCGNSNCVC